jgi:hypothetical protein
MPDPQLSSGFQTVIESGAGAFFAAALAFLQRYQNSKRIDDSAQASKQEQVATDIARRNLDVAQQAFFERLTADNDRYRAEAQLWEARARRIDRIAHDQRHKWANERQMAGNFEPLERLPLLEDPIT